MALVNGNRTFWKIMGYLVVVAGMVVAGAVAFGQASKYIESNDARITALESAFVRQIAIEQSTAATLGAVRATLTEHGKRADRIETKIDRLLENR